jgi:hypothetical protein
VFNREFRLVITGEDGFPYVEEFQKAAKYGEGVFIYVNATAFPRRSRVLRFRLQHHDGPIAPWHTVAEFRRRNPVDESDDWSAETAPIHRTSGPFEFIAGQVAVETNHSNEMQSFWASTVTIPFQLRENGIIQTNWNLHQVTVRMDPADPDSRLSYAAAWDERGESVGGQAQSAAQFEFWKSLPSIPAGSDIAPGSPVTLHVAVTRNVPVEFTIRPRLIESKGPREFDSGNAARTNSP